MEFLIDKKDHLKGKVKKLYQCYGNLCATNPLPMIISSVFIVLICSLPLLSHPVFERTATFIFGRIQLEKYKTNISLSSMKSRDKSSILIQQINLNLNVRVHEKDQKFPFEKWKVFQRTLEISGVKNLSNFCRTSKSFNWTSDCLHVSRKPFYKSPQTRLIYPRGKFYKELRKWFSKSGCLFVSPATITAIKERRFQNFPEQFKELLIGYPIGYSGLADEGQDRIFHFRFTVSLFLKKYNERFYASLKNYFNSKENSTVSLESIHTYKVEYLPTEEDDNMELILLSVTYVLVFFYILFSVGKIKMLKSRWGLAFSAVMTIIMSMIMALGLCASLDLLPNTLTITEIFPYVVIVIGLENVLTITKSVMSTDGDMDVATKVAKGMGKEGWYITKNLVAELTILGAGYFTRIPSLQEFCTFAYVGVLSDFFIQMVFFAPVLSVDIRRAEICHLEQITIGQQFAVGFNLMQKTALTLVPPSPPKSLRSKYFERMRKRIVQKALMTAVVFYIIYAVYNKVQDEKSESVVPQQKHETTGDAKGDRNPGTDAPKTFPLPDQVKTEGYNYKNVNKPLKNSISNDGNEASLNNSVASWEFLSKKHWPELLTFYHIPFNEKSLLILPTIQVSMNISINQTEPNSVFKFSKISKMDDFLLISLLIVFSFISIVFIWVIFLCVLKRKRRTSYSSDLSIFEINKVVYRGHKHCIESIYSDESNIVTVSIAGNVKVWDTLSTCCLMELTPNKGQPSYRVSSPVLRRRNRLDSCRFPALQDHDPTCSVWCLDCKYNMLVVAFSTGSIEVHAINGRKLIACFKEDEAVVGLKVASRNTVIIGRIDGVVDIVEIHRSQFDSIEDLESQADCQINATNDGTTFGYRIKHRIKAHIGPIEYLLVNSGTAFCLSADMMKVYEIDDANCCNSLCLNGKQITTVHHIKEINGLMMAIGCDDGCIFIINSTGDKTVEYRWHDSNIESVCSKSNAIASLDVDKKISVWSVDGEVQFTITQNLPSDTYAVHFLNSVTLCMLSQAFTCLYHVQDGSLLRRIELEPDVCGGTKVDLVCYPGKNSIAIAKGTSFELISFPNLNQLEREENVDR